MHHKLLLAGAYHSAFKKKFAKFFIQKHFDFVHDIYLGVVI